MGSTRSRSGHHEGLVAEPESPLHVSTLESAAISGSPHSTREDQHDSHQSLVATGNLVPEASCGRPASSIQDTTNNSASSSRAKRQRPA